MSTYFDSADWRTILHNMKRGLLVPVISDRIFLPNKDKIIKTWSDVVDYPFPLEPNYEVTQLAQFYSTVTSENIAKGSFLEHLKQQLFTSILKKYPSLKPEFLNELTSEIKDDTNNNISKFFDRLNYSPYDDDENDPVNILARLNVPIYITTSYHQFLEDKLSKVGKNPRPQITYWYQELKFMGEYNEKDYSFVPDIQNPLVLHLLGLDTKPETMVFTEDDYFRFLIEIAQDRQNTAHDLIYPSSVRNALALGSLLLLGYRLNDWAFKAFFQGLILTRERTVSRKMLKLAIQLEQEEADIIGLKGREKVEEYLKKYLQKASFEVYWGSPEEFVKILWQKWQQLN